MNSPSISLECCSCTISAHQDARCRGKVKWVTVFLLILHILCSSVQDVCQWQQLCRLGNSRKYPYPTTDGFHVLTPPCLRKFQNALPSQGPQNPIIVNLPSPSEFPFFLEAHFRLSNADMNKRTFASSRLCFSGARRQALLFSDKKDLPLVARLYKLLFKSRGRVLTSEFFA